MHESSALLDAQPGIRVLLLKRLAQCLVSQSDTIFNVGCVVRGACRRDDIDLQGHAGTEVLGRAAINGRAHPFVQMYQVSGIQTDAKERIAKVAVYNVEQLTPWDADPNVFIPLNYSTEVGRDQLINVISD